MDRLACIDLPAFPLQLLLRRERGWRGRPVAVVAADKPQAEILWLNEKARRAGILPGMRYAAGLALSRELCAGVVGEPEIEQGHRLVAGKLRTLGPDVEPRPGDPGAFWIGARGLDLLHPSLAAWARRLHAALRELGFFAAVVVGFDRFATRALARAMPSPGVRVLATPESERTAALRVPLARLDDLDARARDELAALGVRTAGDLVRLPPAALRDRFGETVHALHRAARGEAPLPVQPEPAGEPLCERLLLDDGERDTGRLLFAIKRLLDPLLARLARRRQTLATLVFELGLERGPGRVETLRPADPTLDARQLLDLLMLRLEALRLRAGVVELALHAEGAPATAEQLELFAQRPRRDPAAIRRAFARLRAELGDRAVVRAELAEGHLPEANFRWTPLRDLPRTARARLGRRTLVRRLRTLPFALPHRPRHEEDGWQLRGRDDAAIDRLAGPFVVSGGWWRTERCRHYYFARTRHEEWLWVFFDRHRRRWLLQGRVE